MFDLKTLMFSLFIMVVLLAGMMVMTGRMQKTYPGFDLWSASLVALAVADIFLMLRGLIPDIVSILGGNLLMVLSLLFMADSLHRFYTASPLTWQYYLILVPVAVINIVYTLVYDSISLRALFFSLVSIIVIFCIIRILKKTAPDHDISVRNMIIAFYFLAVIMALRAADWVLTPSGRDLFENTPLNSGLYIAGIITLITATFFYLNLNFHRLADELRSLKERADTLLFDLDLRNRDLEQVSTSLWTLNNELDQKVRERTRKIENLLFQKDQFIHQIAHDLRTPLTPLVALVPQVRQGITDPDGREMLGIIEKNVGHLRDMTEQIVRLADLNSRCSITDYHTIRLVDLMQDAVRKNTVPIQDRDIHVELSIPSHLSVCVSKVFGHSIFSNIIHNAAKYNVRSGKITITAVEEESSVLISIADTGIGMTSETLDRIWNELYIGDTSRNDPLSKGLGLSMVRKIVALHGGEITATSPGIGEGSTFTIRLPRLSPDDRCRSDT